MAVIPCVATTTRTMGEICDAVDGIIRTGPFGSQLHESDYTASGTPVVMPKNIVSGRVSTDDIARIGVTDSDRLAQHKLQVGDIVYGRRGDIGRRALITNREAGWLCGTGCLRISLGDAVIDPRFLYYYLGLPNVVRWIANKAVGATLPNLNTEILRSVEVTYPPLPVQRKIAGILSAYDDLIENNTRRIAILEEMAQALYREWFVEFRFPGHENVRMVESPLGAIPEGWRVARMGDICHEVRSGVDPEDIDSETPYIGLEHLPRRSIAIADWGAAKDIQSAKLRFHEGDILFGKIRPYFHKVAVAPVAGICSTDAIVIEPNSDDLFGLVLGCASSDDFVIFATKTSQGTKMPRANWDVLTKYPIFLPPSSISCRFDRLAKDVVSQVHNLTFRSRNLRVQRDLLLPRLVSGEVDVEQIAIRNEVDVLADRVGTEREYLGS